MRILKILYIFVVLLGYFITVDGQVETEYLESLANTSKDNVINIDQNLYQDLFVKTKSRDYSLIVFPTAKTLLEKSNFQLGKVKGNYHTLAKTYWKQRKEHNHQLFFMELEFTEQEIVFKNVGIDVLPYLFCITPDWKYKASVQKKIPKRLIMDQQNYPETPWSANSIADFVADKTGVKIQEIEEPKITQNKFFPLIALGVLISLVIIGDLILSSPLIHNQWLQMTACLLVFWYAASGGLYCIIRGMPMILPKKGGTQLFMQGQGQLGAEGYIVGFLYLIFGLSIAVITHVVPTIKNERIRRYSLYTLLVLAFYACSQTLSLFYWKTGLKFRVYLT